MPSARIVEHGSGSQPPFPSGREEKRRALLAAVEQVRDVVARNADEAEDRGTLPPDTVAALADAGLFKLKLPAVLGGAEADPVTHTEVIEALSTIDSSAGWCTMVGTSSIGLMGAFLGDEAIEQIFRDGRVPLAAAVTMPAGRAVAVDGGHQVAGRWPFASGIRHSQWLAGGALVASGDERPPSYRMFAFPTAAAEIADNWHVAGLQGTGSSDFTLGERFVSEPFSWDLLSGPPMRGGPLYNIRAPGFMANEHAGFALGVARRALDAIVEVAGTKRRGPLEAPSSLANRPVFQRAVGECDLRLRAARALVVEVNEKGWTEVSEGRPVEPLLLAEMRGVAAFATAVAVDVTTQAFRYSGGAALYRTNVLQRCLRDINAAAQHIAVSDSAYENLGQFALGLPGANPRG